jgi:hypothetical protein
MRRLAPHRRPLVTFAAVGIVTGFLLGWLGIGKLLAGVALAALVAVALGAGFALFARVLAVGPPSLDRAQSRAAEQSARGQSHDVRRDRDGGERF